MNNRRKLPPGRALRNWAGQRATVAVVHCSALVLSSLGILGALAPEHAVAQGVGGTLPASTVPVVRGVVSGTLTYSASLANSAGGQSLVIQQTTPRGVISFESFNIGKGSDVTFYQPSVTASTLSRIYGQDPSVIQGALRSRLWDPTTGQLSTSPGGQLVLINQNGILFDRGSQVSTGGLIASTLNLRNDKFLSGVITSATEAAFEGGYGNDGAPLPQRPGYSRAGTISVGSFGAASEAAPQIDASPGTAIFLFASRVDVDAGFIKAPDGQVIIAAGKKVFLAQNPNASDFTLRGLVVEVQAEDSGLGLNLTNYIRNAGDISADRGNVSLVALAVNQEGRVSAKTAVQYNGSIYLKGRARTATGAEQAGTVTLALGSQTEVRPDKDDTATVAESVDYTPYRGLVDIQGGVIASRGTVIADGGRVLLTAANAADPKAARVYLAETSTTSAAGAWSDVAFAKSLATFRVTSNELKNSPDQKTGLLRGATVTVDLRKTNNILALDGYRGTVARTVAEKAAVGGDIAITSTGDLIQRQGATLDVSGGGYRYSAGFANTTRLLGADGKVYDIASAPQGLTYTAQLDRFESVNTRFNLTTVYANPLGSVATFQQAYVEGKAGGSLAVGSANGLVLDGTLRGGVTIGTEQLNAAPSGASFVIGNGYRGDGGNRSYNAGQRIGNVNWQQQAADSLGAAFAQDGALSAAQRDSFSLAATQAFGPARQTADGIMESGFGKVVLNSDGRISVPAGVRLQSDPAANLSLNGRTVDIAGDISLPAGTIGINLVDLGTVIAPNPVGTEARIALRTGARVSTAGIWINRASRDGSFVGNATPSGRLGSNGSPSKSTIDGGTITIAGSDQSRQSQLERGSVLDVSGGAAISSTQRVTAGNGGALSIANGLGGQGTSDWLQADLLGHALGNGGKLSLSMNSVILAPTAANGTVPADTTRLPASLFAEAGFSNIGIKATGETGVIDVASDTALVVRQKNFVLDPAAAIALPTGANLRDIVRVQALPDDRRAAASVTLDAAVVTVRDRARIATDPRGTILVSATDSRLVDGGLAAPGGSISLTLRGRGAPNSTDLQLGSGASLSTKGTFVRTPNDAGRTLGTLVNGGTITLSATAAGVQLNAGAEIDVSGVKQEVDTSSSYGAPAFGRQTLVGHAGTVVVKSQGQTTIAANLIGHGSDATAAGGSFALESTRPDGELTLPAARRIVVTRAGQAVATAPATSDTVLDVDALAQGGFAKLRLLSENVIQFQGSSTLSFERGIRLDAPLIDVAGSAQVRLVSAQVALGQSLGPRELDSGTPPVWRLSPDKQQPVQDTRVGTGRFTVEAGTVDFFGNLTLNGAAVSRIESKSDVRFSGRSVSVSVPGAFRGAESRQLGWLHTAGSLEFRAAQLYPTTRSDFTVAVANQPTASPPAGAYLLVSGNGNLPGAVYSAGGALGLQAPTIVQNGAVRAPQGQLNVAASTLLELGSGSTTSVSADGLTVLYGSTISGLTWNYTDGGAGSVSVLASTAGQGKRIDLSAPDLAVRSGATVDLRGGGDVLAVEFVPGNGGDTDITVAAANTFAIIPKARLAAMPYDNDLMMRKDPGFGFSVANGRDTALYDSIDIGTGSTVPAGEYALLPARFSLLPDAYLVQLQTDTIYRSLQPGQTVALVNGSVAAAGHRTAMGTDVRETQSVGVVVLPGSAVQKSSDFTLSGAALFAQSTERSRSTAPAAPWDAGRLGLANVQTLTLQGLFLTDSGTAKSLTPARAAQVDISGNRIAVVDQAASPSASAGFLQLRADSLNRLNASVLLGGSRSETADGVRITTAASEVQIANTSANPLVLPELLLSATGRIDIAAGSALAAAGTQSFVSPGVIQLESNGAFVRLSTGAQATLKRDAGGAGTGVTSIGTGAVLDAARSLLIDATGATQSTGVLRAGGANGEGGSLSLSSGQLNLGQTSAASAPLTGLTLSNDDLARYASLDELVLRGTQGIDLIGLTSLGSSSLNRLSIDTPVLRGIATVAQPAQAAVVAQDLSFINSNAAATNSLRGAGSLSLQADTLSLGGGEKAVTGFGAVNLRAQGVLRTEGKGSLLSAGGLAVEAPLITAASASQQRLSTADSFSATSPVYAAVTLSAGTATATAVTAAAAAKPGLGGLLTIEGSRIDVNTAVQAASGAITLNALGANSGDGITLASAARRDVAGGTKDFNGSVVAAGGGSVTLTAARGAVALAAGAQVDVSAATYTRADGQVLLLGEAGSLTLRGETFTPGGKLIGLAAANQRQGSVDIDLERFSGPDDFSALNEVLNRGGFLHSRQLRLRTGDIAVKATDAVPARSVSFSADAGRIDVAGTVGSGAAEGGAQVTLNAQTGLRLGATAQILAQASNDGARGGEVRLSTRSGALEFANKARIDVRAGAAGPAGAVVFAVTRDAQGNVDPRHDLQGTVNRFSASGGSVASVDVEAMRVYGPDAVGSRITSTQIAAWAAEHRTFIENSSALATRITGGLRDERGALAGARLLGAVELQALGDLSLDANWDLRGLGSVQSPWLSGDRPGTLSIRAAGTLRLNNTLGAPNERTDLPTDTRDVITNRANFVLNDTNQNENHRIVAGDTWSIRLVGGADLPSADAMATVARPAADTGNLLFSGSGASVRTGTGRIDLAAARDVRFDSVFASVYTGGKIGARDDEVNGNNRWAVDGGSITVRAGGNIDGPQNTRDLWVTEWLRRPRQTEANFRTTLRTDWWVYRPRFQQAVGTLAGGDIDIRAGGDVREFSAMIPTLGRTAGSVADGSRSVEVTGGGNLDLQAGGSIVGGGFMVGRGAGRVQAAADIGRSQTTQVYLMGLSSGAVPEGATLKLTAGGSVALQNANNPTTLFLSDTNGPAGPSFNSTTPALANSTASNTFYTYAANSAVSLLAKSGDLSYAGILATDAPANWRIAAGPSQTAVTAGYAQTSSSPGALPSSLALVALEGGIVSTAATALLQTFPSPSASVSFLAGKSVTDLRLEVSDLSPGETVTPFSNASRARAASTFSLSSILNVSSSGTKSRITVRDPGPQFGVDASVGIPDYLTDIQALGGNISSSNVVSTAVSRLRAGSDIVNTQMTLQNLHPDDVSEIRADTGDIRNSASNIGGPGRLLLQAGRNIEFGFNSSLIAVGNSLNPQLPSGPESARLTLIAGVSGNVNLAAMDTPPGQPNGSYDELIAINRVSQLAQDFYAQLGTESSAGKILAAKGVAELAVADPAYQAFVALDARPGVLAGYQNALRGATLPLAAGADREAAVALYRLLNAEPDATKMRAAGNLAALAELAGGSVYAPYLALDQRYGRLFTDYVLRRNQGATPVSITPIVFSDTLQSLVAKVVPNGSVSSTGGSILSYQSTVQTQGGSDIDLWAPKGDIVVGLTTPVGTNTVGVLTTAGGAIRSVLSGNFNVNQGKVITAQGGDILLFSSQGSIDAGRGAKTSATTAPPVITIKDDGTTEVNFSSAATGSGIQSLTSDPDGLRPRPAPPAGNVYLFAPAGSIDAGEAGIRSGGNILINAQVVRNASDIRAGGSSQGVPQLQVGNLASALASSNSGGGTGKAAEDAAKAAGEAARKAAAAPPPPKPTILSVEVLGFGDKNCKEDDKECFAK